MRPMFSLLVLAINLVCLACSTISGSGPERVRVSARSASGLRVLVVVAHPDDEIAFASEMYKIGTHLGGSCDVVLITNGEGGFKYSTLAESIYDLELTDEAVGRAHLPEIRKREFLAGCEIMHVRDAYFLNQRDHRYTQDAEEVIGANPVWDLEYVLASLTEIMERGQYDFLFTHAPTAGTHGHHKSATILALQALLRLAPSERPTALCVRHGRAGEDVPEPPGLERYPVTRVSEDPPLRFDRNQPFGHCGRLNYKIIANWAIAEHKTQGTMQLFTNSSDFGYFFSYALNPPARLAGAKRLFERLTEPQFEAKVYGESAGTNAVQQ